MTVPVSPSGINAQKKFYLNPIPDSFYSGNTDTLAAIDGDHFREDYYAWTWGDVLFIVFDPFQYTMRYRTTLHQDREKRMTKGRPATTAGPGPGTTTV